MFLNENKKPQNIDVLQKEGFVDSFDEKPVREGISELSVKLKYYQGRPTIKFLKRVSKPGRRVYSSFSDLKPIYNGMGRAVLSTSKGIITDVVARSEKVGGEVLCYVY